MFENIINFFKNIGKKEENKQSQENSKNAAKERLHLVLMQDRANVSADFLELMKQEIIDVIKKYIEIDEKEIDVRLTNKENEDGTNGAPALYANIPISSIVNYFFKAFFIFLQKPSFFLPGIVTSTFSPKILLAISIYALPDGAFLFDTAGSPLFV